MSIRGTKTLPRPPKALAGLFLKLDGMGGREKSPPPLRGRVGWGDQEKPGREGRQKDLPHPSSWATYLAPGCAGKGALRVVVELLEPKSGVLIDFTLRTMKLYCNIELTTVWNGAARRSMKIVVRTIGSR